MIFRATGLCLLLTVAAVPAADPAHDSQYQQAILGRAEKIVAGLGLSDTNQAVRVRDSIVRQYQDLRQLHEKRDAQARAEGNLADKDAIKQARQRASEALAPEMARLHAAFLERLSADLTPTQVDQVKDGMTYGVVPITYGVYLKMYPALTEEEKEQVMTWMTEARELAMDQGTSEEKHAVFNKFKGRINNYLSKAGYDARKGAENLKKK